MSSLKSILSTILLSLSLFIFSSEGIPYPKPESCHRFECPSYEVVHSQKEFEIRNYTVATWLSTPIIHSATFNNATKHGFKKIYSYIKGNNKEGKTIKMTAPILVGVTPPIWPSAGVADIIVYFYLPREFQKKHPSSNELTPLKLPTNKLVAVRRFGGFVNDSIIGHHSEVEALRTSLKGTPFEGKFDSLAFDVAIYNAPFEVNNRVNEVMLEFVY